ncbi:hypothetical protein MmiHf6_13530 [Methanimicrococcus hongohii]|uniref:DUF4825 domain-containing protein n=1 Tax=Methanimicrococcus hongohii TaxID=3028295 RepID=A0AA96V1B5_9EURY|nr:hypothetical protein [Methanimicrococcus sp. Hf6]WNY24028.1 hypothetical protein MmiHf6_13530 [Methanimicrococcus sp. Hf6]
MNLSKNQKILLAVIGIVLILFVVFNAVWLMNYKSYDRFERDDYTRPFGSSYVLSKDGFHYNIKYPDYLQFSGNLGITNEADTLSMIIWPQAFKSNEYEVGIIIYDAGSEYSFYLYLDSDLNMNHDKMNLTEESSDIAEKLLEERRDEIEEMYSLAENEWNLSSDTKIV